MRRLQVILPNIKPHYLLPVLISIYLHVNDLTNSASKFNHILFADDTNIFSKDPQLLKENL